MRFLPNEKHDYVIARKKIERRTEVFSVAKFTTGDAPEKLYYVTVTPKEVTCTCDHFAKAKVPPKRPCRHCLMTAIWVLNGDKDPEVPSVKQG